MEIWRILCIITRKIITKEGIALWGDSTILKTILGSAVISTSITAFFTHLSNRKENTLSHITDERKVWRNSIKDIAGKIQDCKYHGTGEEDINKYLVRLKVNINPYGKGSTNDFEHDAHIWMEIDEIEKVKKKKDFEKHKELLIYYVSLMLKEDWERSKNEIKGYSVTILEIMAFLTINCTLTACYIYYQEYNQKDSDMLSVSSIYFVIAGTLIIYGIIKYMLSIYIGRPVKDFKIRKNYLFENIITFSIVIVVVALCIGCSIPLIGPVFYDHQGLFYILLIAGLSEIGVTCYNWFRIKCRKFLLSCRIVEEREKMNPPKTN